MTSAVVVNSLGLTADIAGAVLLWRFGLPEEISRSGSRFLAIEGTDLAEKATGAHYDRYSRLGMALLIGGFALQLASNFLR